MFCKKNADLKKDHSHPVPSTFVKNIRLKMFWYSCVFKGIINNQNTKNDQILFFSFNLCKELFLQ